MARPGNPAWQSLTEPGVESPQLKIIVSENSKAFLVVEAKKEGVSLSEYCRGILDDHIADRISELTSVI